MATLTLLPNRYRRRVPTVAEEIARHLFWKRVGWTFVWSLVWLVFGIALPIPLFAELLEDGLEHIGVLSIHQNAVPFGFCMLTVALLGVATIGRLVWWRIKR
jgi:hypothetical protein